MKDSVGIFKRALTVLLLLLLAVIAAIPLGAFGETRYATAATEDIRLTLYVQYPGQKQVVAKEFTHSDLRSLSLRNATPSGGYIYNAKVLSAASYVSVEQIVEAAGLSFEPGDTFTASGGDLDATYTYAEIKEPRYFFPAYTGSSAYLPTVGMVKVPTGIALQWNTKDIDWDASTAQQAYQEALKTAYDSGNNRFMIGLTQEEYLGRHIEGNRMPTYVATAILTKGDGSSGEGGGVPGGGADGGKDEDQPGVDSPGGNAPGTSGDPGNAGDGSSGLLPGDGSGNDAAAGDDADSSDPGDADDAAGSANRIPLPSGDPDAVVLDYVDLGSGDDVHWAVAEGYVRKAVAWGLMSGYETASGNVFDPDGSVTRAQVVTVLYRHANPDSPATTDPNSYGENKVMHFTDNPDGRYYTEAVNWAYRIGVLKGDMLSNGEPAGTVRPDDPVTRQDLAVMLQRYAAYLRQGVTAQNPAGYQQAPDRNAVADYADDAMAWCYDKGILTGSADTGMLMPANSASRAEFCKMAVTLIEIMSR